MGILLCVSSYDTSRGKMFTLFPLRQFETKGLYVEVDPDPFQVKTGTSFSSRIVSLPGVHPIPSPRCLGAQRVTHRTPTTMSARDRNQKGGYLSLPLSMRRLYLTHLVRRVSAAVGHEKR